MKASIVMASCNPNKELLRLALVSIMRQSYTDYEVIIVDDGSKEPVENYVKEITNDSRVRVLRIQNSGLGAALNYGIEHSSGEYIARLDDDDMMEDSRIQKQIDYLDSHPEVSCVGTWHYDKIGDRCYPHRKFPTGHEEIVKSLLVFRFALAHTTLMFRRTAFDKIGGYRIPRGGQDLDLELQLGTVGKLANLGEYLNYYTMSATGLGTINPKKYEAYLFALEDVVKRNLYPKYQNIANDTVKKLRKINSSPLKNVREKAKRFFLIQRVKLVGKKLHY